MKAQVLQFDVPSRENAVDDLDDLIEIIHIINEHVEISSIEHAWKYMLELLKNISQPSGNKTEGQK